MTSRRSFSTGNVGLDRLKCLPYSTRSSCLLSEQFSMPPPGSQWLSTNGLGCHSWTCSVEQTAHVRSGLSSTSLWQGGNTAGWRSYMNILLVFRLTKRGSLLTPLIMATLSEFLESQKYFGSYQLVEHEQLILETPPTTACGRHPSLLPDWIHSPPLTILDG